MWHQRNWQNYSMNFAWDWMLHQHRTYQVSLGGQVYPSKHTGKCSDERCNKIMPRKRVLSVWVDRSIQGGIEACIAPSSLKTAAWILWSLFHWHLAWFANIIGIQHDSFHNCYYLGSQETATGKSTSTSYSYYCKKLRPAPLLLTAILKMAKIMLHWKFSLQHLANNTYVERVLGFSCSQT